MRGHEQARHNAMQYVARKRQAPDAREHLGGTQPRLGGRERSWGAFWRGCQLPLHLEDVQLAVHGASEKE